MVFIWEILALSKHQVTNKDSLCAKIKVVRYKGRAANAKPDSCYQTYIDTVVNIDDSALVSSFIDSVYNKEYEVYSSDTTHFSDVTFILDSILSEGNINKVDSNTILNLITDFAHDDTSQTSIGRIRSSMENFRNNVAENNGRINRINLCILSSKRNNPVVNDLKQMFAVSSSKIYYQEVDVRADEDPMVKRIHFDKVITEQLAWANMRIDTAKVGRENKIITFYYPYLTINSRLSPTAKVVLHTADSGIAHLIFRFHPVYSSQLSTDMFFIIKHLHTSLDEQDKQSQQIRSIQLNQPVPISIPDTAEIEFIATTDELPNNIQMDVWSKKSQRINTFAVNFKQRLPSTGAFLFLLFFVMSTIVLMIAAICIMAILKDNIWFILYYFILLFITMAIAKTAKYLSIGEVIIIPLIALAFSELLLSTFTNIFKILHIFDKKISIYKTPIELLLQIILLLFLSVLVCVVFHIHLLQSISIVFTLFIPIYLVCFLWKSFTLGGLFISILFYCLLIGICFLYYIYYPQFIYILLISITPIHLIYFFEATTYASEYVIFFSIISTTVLFCRAIVYESRSLHSFCKYGASYLDYLYSNDFDEEG